MIMIFLLKKTCIAYGYASFRSCKQWGKVQQYSLAFFSCLFCKLAGSEDIAFLYVSRFVLAIVLFGYVNWGIGNVMFHLCSV